MTLRRILTLSCCRTPVLRCRLALQHASQRCFILPLRRALSDGEAPSAVGLIGHTRRHELLKARSIEKLRIRLRHLFIGIKQVTEQIFKLVCRAGSLFFAHLSARFPFLADFLAVFPDSCGLSALSSAGAILCSPPFSPASSCPMPIFVSPPLLFIRSRAEIIFSVSGMPDGHT